MRRVISFAKPMVLDCSVVGFTVGSTNGRGVSKGKMSFESTLAATIEMIISNPLGFSRQVGIIRQTRYRKKFKFEPFADFSTTMSNRTCSLANNWEEWIPVSVPQPVFHFARMANLIHEATHGYQRDISGNASFNASYLFQKSARYRYEIDAYRAQIKYAMLYFGMTASQAMPYIQGQAALIANNYLLGKDYPQERAMSDLARGL